MGRADLRSPRAGPMPSATLNQVSTTVIARLTARRSGLEQAILTRVYGIADPTAVSEQRYVDGLRHAVFAALDYGFSIFELGANRRVPPVPPVLLVQARLAARNRVSLDTVLRRYCGGNTLFSDALIEEAERTNLPRSELKRLLRIQASSFDRLIAAVSEEYAREPQAQASTSEQRRADLVERLLVGELVDASQLNYNFDSWHLGVLVAGPGASEVLRTLAEMLDRALLIVDREETVWAWLGGRRPYGILDWQECLTSSHLPERTAIGVDEPSQGLLGWRLTHRQAAAALPIALHGKRRVTYYAQAPLLASALHDDLLASSLRQLYLAPLEQERDGGVAAKNTLRAYFAAAGNVSSAAATLGVSRVTVRNRLAMIEARFGRSPTAAAAEIETALRLDEIEEAPDGDGPAGRA